MLLPTKDRLALIRSLKSIQISVNSAGGILHHAHAIGLYHPSSADQNYCGIFGDTLQNIVGPAYAGAMADYFDVELKTHREESSSPVTLGYCSLDDFNDSFAKSRLFRKCKKMVVATLAGKDAPKFGHAYVTIPDMKIKDIYSVDLTKSSVFKLFENDFEKIKTSWNTVGHAKGVDTKYLILDESNGKRRWRMKQAAVRMLVGSDTLDENPLFEP